MRSRRSRRLADEPADRTHHEQPRRRPAAPRAQPPRRERPTYFFNKAVEADPADPDYFFNLGYAYWLERDIPAAIYWLREAVRRDPADGDAHYVLGAALHGGRKRRGGHARKRARAASVVDLRRMGEAPGAGQRAERARAAQDVDVELPRTRVDRRRSRDRATRSAGARALLSRSRPAAVTSRRTTARRWPS